MFIVLQLPVLLREDSVLLPADQLRSLRDRLTALMQEHNAANPTLFIHLYPDTIELVARITHLLSLPHDISTTLLIGIQGAEPVAHLVAANAGYTVVRPSQLFCSALLSNERTVAGVQELVQFEPEGFSKAMKSIYTMAGVKVCAWWANLSQLFL